VRLYLPVALFPPVRLVPDPAGHIRESTFTDIMPAIVAHNEAVHIHAVISEGAEDPASLLIAITVAGMSWIADVFKTRNIHIASEAVSFLAFTFCNSSMAFIPSGVAALPSPMKFAARFITMAPMALSLPLSLGKNSLNTGLAIFAMTFIRPPFSIIFINPDQRHMIPSSPTASSTALPADVYAACVTSSTLPFSMPIMKPAASRPGQI
jgi:hypothetical protein